MFVELVHTVAGTGSWVVHTNTSSSKLGAVSKSRASFTRKILRVTALGHDDEEDGQTAKSEGKHGESHDSTISENDEQGGVEALLMSCLGGANVGVGCDDHPAVSSEGGQESAHDESRTDADVIGFVSLAGSVGKDGKRMKTATAMNMFKCLYSVARKDL